MDQNTQINSKDVGTVRLIDINSEILKGKGVKPGLVLLEDDPVIDLTEESHCNSDKEQSQMQQNVKRIEPQNTNKTSAEPAQPISKNCNPVASSMTKVIPLKNLVSHVKLTGQNIQCSAPLSSTINKPTTVYSPEMYVQNLYNQLSTSACNSISGLVGLPKQDLSSIIASKTCTTLSDLQKGFKVLNPTKVSSAVLQSSCLQQLPKEHVKNTIISLPNKVYLIPVSYFKKNNLVEIPGNSKIASFVDELESMKSVKNDVVKNCCIKNSTVKICACVQNGNTSTGDINKNKFTQPELFRKCWYVKKHRKIDLEGFTIYDRLGFSKTELTRVRKCLNLMSRITAEKEKEICELTAKLRRIRKNEITIARKKQARKQALALAALTKRYHLKECSIQLDRNEVTDYFKRRCAIVKKRRSQRRAYTEFEIPLTFETVSTTFLRGINFTKPVLFINHHNYGTINFADSEIQTILFINTNNLVTDMCLDVCPQLKTAVKKKVVKIVNEKDLENFIGASAHQNISGQLVNRKKVMSWNNERMSRFRTFLLKNSQDRQKFLRGIQLDHSYCLEPSKENTPKSLLEIQKSVPFR